jgi:hypothetical protein
MTGEQWAAVDAYSKTLEGAVVAVISAAMERLQPATLDFGETSASFASNYRFKTDKGYIHKANPEGVVDRTVPVLRVAGLDGKTMAVVFGYACHPTVATAVTQAYLFHGDYAGVAQQRLEDEFAGATALFVQGFGGDAKAEPRGTMALAEKYGAELAGQVSAMVRGVMTPVRGPIKAVFERVTLDLLPPAPREEWERRAQSPNANIARNARAMLDTLDRDGRIPSQYRYPIQVWQFGPDFTLLALGGETLVDYAIRFRKELGLKRAWFAGYSNDVSCYIPSVRVLKEGGYEPDESMIYYVWPGPFAPTIEEKIVGKTRELVERVRTAVKVPSGR